MTKMSKDIFRHSTIMLIATVTSKFFSYIFYFLMARLLTPEEYGILGALMSFFFIATVFTTGIQPAIAKFAAKFYEKNEKGKLKTLMIISSKKLGIYGAIGFFTISLFSPFISSFLHISSNTSVVIIGLCFALYAVLIAVRGILQGIGDFFNLGVNLSIEAILRVVFGVILVTMGFGVNGAIFALVLATIMGVLFGILPLKFLLREIREKINAREIYTYSFPVILTSFALVAMLNIDVILVKHYFDARTAGYYAAASLLAKIPLILVRESLAPVIFTYAAKGRGKTMLKTIIKYTIVLIFPVIFLYWFIPEVLVEILYGSAYIFAAQYMKWLVLPMIIMGFNTIGINYLLAKGKITFVKYLLVLLILEVLQISLFHNNIFYVIGAIALTFLLLGIAIYILSLKK